MEKFFRSDEAAEAENEEREEPSIKSDGKGEKENSNTLEDILTMIINVLHNDHQSVQSKHGLWLTLYMLIHDKILRDPLSIDITNVNRALAGKQPHQLLAGRETIWEDLMFLVGNVLCRNSMYHDGRTLKDLYKTKDVLIEHGHDMTWTWTS